MPDPICELCREPKDDCLHYVRDWLRDGRTEQLCDDCGDAVYAYRKKHPITFGEAFDVLKEKRDGD